MSGPVSLDGFDVVVTPDARITLVLTFSDGKKMKLEASIETATHIAGLITDGIDSARAIVSTGNVVIN